MKLPTGKNKALLYGGGAVGGLVIFLYIRKKKAAASAAATDTSGVDPNAIDPATGITYGQEQGASYVGAPSGFITGTGSVEVSGTGQAYTTNSAWMSDALQDAQNYYGATYALATTALGKYLSQTPQGLLPDEYQLVSEVVAQIGQPPVNGPYRLIQGAPVSTGGGQGTGGGGGTPPPPPPPPSPQPTPDPHAGMHWQNPQVATLEHGVSLVKYWQWHYPGNQSALDTLIALNPGLGPNDATHQTMMIKTSDGRWVPN